MYSYAAVNSVILEFNGEVSGIVHEDLYISNVSVVSNVNADIDNSKIINMYQTVLNSSIVLSETDGNSSITYSVTLNNSTNENYYFYSVDYLDDETSYSNPNIIFNVTGIEKGTLLGPNQSITFNITFSYKDGIVPTDNILNSYLNFVFKRKFQITYENLTNSNVFPNEVYEGENIQLDLSNSSVNTVKVYVGDIEYQEYTFINNILTIENVNSDLIVNCSIVVSDIDVPVTDTETDFTIIESTNENQTTVNDLFNKEFTGVNASSKIITRIEFDLIYTSSTGSKQSITSTLTHNGTNYSETTDFNGKVSNQKITIVFDNLNISSSDEFYITNTASKITNGNIQINTGEVRIYFQE